MYDCSASIVTYKHSLNAISNAIDSFLNSNCNVKLTIIDNSPTPSLQFEIKSILVTYHFYGKNVGYGRGHNWGIFNSEPSRYHLILNPDVTITSGTIEKLISFMDVNLDVGMVCPKVFNEDGTIQHLNKRYPTVLDLFLRRFTPKVIRNFIEARLAYYETRDLGYDSVRDVEFMTGCCMFCRTSVLKQVGGFDPQYFLHLEDCDLGRMVQEAGYRTVYFPEATVTHEWKREPYKNFRMMLIMISSMFKYFNKWGWKWY